MGFTPLKDAIEASRAGVMDQIYANYDAELNRERTMAFLANPKSNDPYLNFEVMVTLDADYITQIKDELGAAGWHRVSVNGKPGVRDVWVIRAYRDELKAAPTPAPQPQEPEAPADSDTGDTTETPPAEPADEPAAEPSEPTETDSGTADSEPAQTEPAADAPAQEPATDTAASDEPAEEPAAASDSTAGSTTEPAPTERQNPLLTPKS